MLGRIDDIETEINRHIKECKGIKTINAYMGKIKELDKKVNNMSNIKEKFNKNKARIFVILGETFLWVMGYIGRWLLINNGDSAVGDLLFNIVGILSIGLQTISMYVFGNKTELDDKEGELMALRNSNWQRGYVIEKANLVIPTFEDPNKK